MLRSYFNTIRKGINQPTFLCNSHISPITVVHLTKYKLLSPKTLRFYDIEKKSILFIHNSSKLMLTYNFYTYIQQIPFNLCMSTIVRVIHVRTIERRVMYTIFFYYISLEELTTQQIWVWYQELNSKSIILLLLVLIFKKTDITAVIGISIRHIIIISYGLFPYTVRFWLVFHWISLSIMSQFFIKNIRFGQKYWCILVL